MGKEILCFSQSPSRNSLFVVYVWSPVLPFIVQNKKKINTISISILPQCPFRDPLINDCVSGWPETALSEQHVVLSPHVIRVIDVSCRVLGQAGVGHCMLRIHHICMYCATRYNTVAAKLIVLFSFTIRCCTVSLMESMTGWLPRANSLESITQISLSDLPAP